MIRVNTSSSSSRSNSNNALLTSILNANLDNNNNNNNIPPRFIGEQLSNRNPQPHELSQGQINELNEIRRQITSHTNNYKPGNLHMSTERSHNKTFLSDTNNNSVVRKLVGVIGYDKVRSMMEVIEMKIRDSDNFRAFLNLVSGYCGFDTISDSSSDSNNIMSDMDFISSSVFNNESEYSSNNNNNNNNSTSSAVSNRDIMKTIIDNYKRASLQNPDPRREASMSMLLLTLESLISKRNKGLETATSALEDNVQTTARIMTEMFDRVFSVPPRPHYSAISKPELIGFYSITRPTSVGISIAHREIEKAMQQPVNLSQLCTMVEIYPTFAELVGLCITNRMRMNSSNFTQKENTLYEYKKNDILRDIKTMIVLDNHGNIKSVGIPATRKQYGSYYTTYGTRYY